MDARALSYRIVDISPAGHSFLLFTKKWACHVLDDGRVFVCYDSTNVNSQAEGIFIVQKGHAKDDPDKDQVNTEYTIRQRDGMPVTFKNFPGSLNDMAEASDVITELRNLQDVIIPALQSQ